MRLVIILLSVHFFLGAAGFLISGSTKSAEARKELWKKYFAYLVLVLILIASAATGRQLFMGLCIIIFSGSFFEILLAGKKADDMPTRVLIIKAQIILLIAAFFFSRFILLPTNLVIWTYMTVLIFDGASQVTGMLAGKKKILPVISPGKTFAGTAGGFISAVITAVILRNFAGFTLGEALIFGVIVCASSFAGDMMSSYLKRKTGIKDFSKLLPGQGGMLDRYDSFIASGAVIGFISVFLFPQAVFSGGDISAYLGFSFVFLLILAAVEIFYRSAGWKPEYLRMLIHVLTGITALFLPVFLSSPLYIVAICIQSSIFIYLAQRFGIFMSLHSVIRKTAGTYLFFVGILIAWLVSIAASDISVYYIAVMVLTVGDPVASAAGMFFAGRKRPVRIPLMPASKTLYGSLSFFFSALLLLTSWISLDDPFTQVSLFRVSAIAFLAAVAEAAGSGGTDNVLIPAVVSFSVAISG